MGKRICAPSHAKKLFWLCWVAYMVSCIGRFNYSAAMAELITHEGFSKVGAGLIGTALFAAYGVCQIVTGLLGDKISPKRLLAFGLGGASLMNFCMGFASTERVMLFIWIGNGIFQSCMWSPVARIFAENLPPDMRRGAASSAAATIPVATILIYALASFVIRFYTWRWVFWVPGILMLAAMLVWLPMMTEIERHTAQYGIVEQPAAQGPCAQQMGYGKMIAASGAVLIAFAALSHGLLKDGIQSWLPTFLTEGFSMTTYASTAATLLLPVLNIFGVLLTRWLAAHYIKNELAGAAVFFGIGILCLGSMLLLPIHSALFQLVMLSAASTAMIAENILLMNLIPMRLGSVGRASSMTGFLNCHAYLGSALSSFGVGAAAERFGWSAAIGIWLTFAALALAAVLLNLRRWDRFCGSLQRPS